MPRCTSPRSRLALVPPELLLELLAGFEDELLSLGAGFLTAPPSRSSSSLLPLPDFLEDEGLEEPDEDRLEEEPDERLLDDDELPEDLLLDDLDELLRLLLDERFELPDSFSLPSDLASEAAFSSPPAAASPSAPDSFASS